MIDKKHHIIAILCCLITLIFCNLLVYLNYASYITAIIFPILLILIFKIFKINNKIVNLFINYLIAVSYTHLDVYKRQVMMLDLSNLVQELIFIYQLEPM